MSTKRFLGWQKSPATQASFGGSTESGVKNSSFSVLHSTGDVTSIDAKWYLVDATTAPVGRIATVISTLLMGKHRSTFTPGASNPDCVVVINADKAFFTSDKADKKMYYWHTGYMGGLKSESAKKALERRPDEVIWQAVQGMLPKNKISRYQLAHLKIYSGAEHPHSAQKPIVVDVVTKSLKGLGV